MKQKIKIGEECLFDIYQKSNLAVTTTKVVPIKKLPDCYEVISLDTNEVFRTPADLLTPYKKGQENIVYRNLSGDFDIDDNDMEALAIAIGVISAYRDFINERGDMTNKYVQDAMVDLANANKTLNKLFDKFINILQSKILIKTLSSKPKSKKKDISIHNTHTSLYKERGKIDSIMQKNILSLKGVIKEALSTNTINDIYEISTLDAFSILTKNILYPIIKEYFHIDKLINIKENGSFNFDKIVYRYYKALKITFEDTPTSELENIKLLVFYKVEGEDRIDYFIIDDINNIINGVNLSLVDLYEYLDDNIIDKEYPFTLTVIDLNTLNKSKEDDEDAK